MPKNRGMCRGCHNDFYNGQGAKECWSFAEARIVTRSWVGIWDNPPYVWNPVKILSCHTKQGRHALERNDCRMTESPEAAAELRKKWDDQSSSRLEEQKT